MTNFVVGLDGAHWELLDPWIADGKLPALKQVKDEGVWGDVQSCLPPVTSPNWKCYSTGKNPGKLGVYWWEVVNAETREVYTPMSYDYKSVELWDYLNEEGYSTGVVNMPTTFPAREIDGWMIAGGPSTDDTGYTYPESLESELEANFDYRVYPSSRVASREDIDEEVVDSFLEVIDSRFQVARWLADSKGAEFVHVTIFHVNVLQHFLWDHEYTLKAWQRIDDWLGRLMDAGHSMILMADHGSNEIEWEFNANRWLEDQGYLVLEDTVSGGLHRIGVTRRRLNAVLGRLPFDDAIRSVTPDRLKASIPDKDGQLRRTAKSDLLDWDRSTALASGQGPVYLLTDDRERRAELREEIIEKLRTLRDPAGDPVFKAVYESAQIYHGPYLHVAPDIVGEQREGYHIPGSLGGSEVFTRPEKWVGENKRTALVAAWGQEFRTDGELPSDTEFAITDLMPTVLYWYGAAIPTDVDGEVLPVFAPGSRHVPKEPTFRDPIEVDEAFAEQRRDETMEDRLKDLGYL